MGEYSNDILARLEAMRELKAAAREITLSLFHDGMSVTNKADNGYDPVTQADVYAEKALRDIIQEKFPDDSISGEEFDDISGNSDWLYL